MPVGGLLGAAKVWSIATTVADRSPNEELSSKWLVNSTLAEITSACPCMVALSSARSTWASTRARSLSISAFDSARTIPIDESLLKNPQRPLLAVAQSAGDGGELEIILQLTDLCFDFRPGWLLCSVH